MLLFNNFVHKYGLKNKATSNIKIYRAFSSIGLDNVFTYLRDGSFSSDVGVVNLHQSRGTHWVAYINENFFDRCGCAPPQKLSRFIIKRHGLSLFCEYKIQGLTSKRDSFCAAYCT